MLKREWTQCAVEAQQALTDILAERIRNLGRWGVQDHPSISPLAAEYPDLACNLHGLPSEAQAKERCERVMAAGRVTWTDILMEEFAEAVGAPTEDARRAELVQVAAVAVAWIANIDLRMAATAALAGQEVAS